MGRPLSPHRRWALDTLVEAIRSDTYGVTEVYDKTTGKILHMLGKIAKDEGSTVQFVPVAIIMDSKLLENYDHNVDSQILLNSRCPLL